MTLLDESQALHAMRRPNVRGELPGPRSAALLARQERRESNARVYGRHLPIAVDEARGSFVRDVDGNVFIDFLTGAGVLSLGHNHPELVAVAAEQLGRFMPRPGPAHAGQGRVHRRQLSMLPDADARPDEDALLRPDRRQRRRRRHQAVQDRHRPRRRHRVPGRVPRHHPRGDGAHRDGRPQGARSPTACPASTSSRTRTARAARWACAGHLRDQLRRVPGAGPARSERRHPAAGGGDHGDGAGRGRRRARRTATSCGGCGSSPASSTSRWWSTRCRPAAAGPAPGSPSSSTASSRT